MKEEAPIFPKIKFILKEIAKTKKESYMIDIINHSFFEHKKCWNYNTSGAYDINILLTPAIFTENYSTKELVEKIIKKRIIESSELKIHSIKLLPDYEKLELISSEIKIIYTKWEDINYNQQKLIENIEISKDSADYQNIGNSARILMDKLARNVFNPNIHKTDNSETDLRNGKFKNQLNAYISSELKGKNYKDLRKVAKSSIDFVGNSIDLMNATTHKLNAEKHFAELCVISAISTVSIIKTIDEIS